MKQEETFAKKKTVRKDFILDILFYNSQIKNLNYTLHKVNQKLDKQIQDKKKLKEIIQFKDLNNRKLFLANYLIEEKENLEAIRFRFDISFFTKKFLKLEFDYHDENNEINPKKIEIFIGQRTVLDSIKEKKKLEEKSSVEVLYYIETHLEKSTDSFMTDFESDLIYLNDLVENQNIKEILTLKAYYRFFIHLEVNHFDLNRKIYKKKFSELKQSLESQNLIKIMIAGLYNFGDSHKVMESHFTLFNVISTKYFKSTNLDPIVERKVARLVLDYFKMHSEIDGDYNNHRSIKFLQKIFLCLRNIDLEVYLLILEQILDNKFPLKKFKNLKISLKSIYCDYMERDIYFHKIIKMFWKLVNSNKNDLKKINLMEMVYYEVMNKLQHKNFGVKLYGINDILNMIKGNELISRNGASSVAELLFEFKNEKQSNLNYLLVNKFKNKDNQYV